MRACNVSSADVRATSLPATFVWAASMWIRSYRTGNFMWRMHKHMHSLLRNLDRNSRRYYAGNSSASSATKVPPIDWLWGCNMSSAYVRAALMRSSTNHQVQAGGIRGSRYAVWLCPCGGWIFAFCRP